jgi:hypothetical protein
MVISLCSALGCWRLPADWLGRDSYLILSFLMYMSSLLPARSFSGVNIPQLNSPHRNAAKTSPAHSFLSSFPPPSHPSQKAKRPSITQRSSKSRHHKLL